MIRVTEVLSKYQDFSHVSKDVLIAASERGIVVHKYCADYARGIWTQRPVDYQGYCVSFEKWFDVYINEVVLVEAEVISRFHGYIGHLDIMAIFKHSSAITLIDYKTPVSKSKIWGAQLAAYKNAIQESGYKIDRLGSLRLKADGKPAKFDEYSDNARDFQSFLNALYAHKWFLT